MATVTPAPVIPVNAPFNTNPAYSGSFIPTLWSKKLNAKFYASTMMSEISNTNWEGEIKNQGDTIRIRTAPSVTIKDYNGPGSQLDSEVPTPIYTDMQIDQAKYFSVQVSDVLAYQSDLELMNMFTEDAAKQLKITIENETFFNWFVTNGPAAANEGATAGAISGSFNLGTDVTPIDQATPANVLNVILEMAAVLDEQNVPEDGRWLILSPKDRNLLMQSNIAQAYFTGDSSSVVRSGKIGMLDRFTVYVSNLLPRGAAGTDWNNGLGTLTPGASASAKNRRMIVAGTKHACSFASQITKTEPLRNQTDFGDIVRGLSVFGRKVIKPEALATAIVGAAA